MEAGKVPVNVRVTRIAPLVAVKELRRAPLDGNHTVYMFFAIVAYLAGRREVRE